METENICNSKQGQQTLCHGRTAVLQHDVLSNESEIKEESAHTGYIKQRTKQAEFLKQEVLEKELEKPEE
jgi:hypothetical protein